MASRTEQKLIDTKKEIEEQAPKDCHGVLSTLVIDLENQQNVRDAVKTFLERGNHHLECLMNNAGIYGGKYTLTEDGFEQHLGFVCVFFAVFTVLSGLCILDILR